MENIGGGSRPDQADHAFGNHRAVEDGAALFLVRHAAGHQRGLCGMEAGNRAAGYRDEHHRENRLGGSPGVFGGVHIGHRFPDFRHGAGGSEAGLVNEAGHDADGHEQQAEAEDGVDASNQFVYRQQGRQ